MPLWAFIPAQDLDALRRQDTLARLSANIDSADTIVLKANYLITF